jgi:hypothetical protein
MKARLDEINTIIASQNFYEWLASQNEKSLLETTNSSWYHYTTPSSKLPLTNSQYDMP